MGKDPAVLLYTQDFIAGTLLMTDEQRGKYILLLCIQHQKGFLTQQEMLKICGTYDDAIWAKFIKEGDIYFNRRMREESEKRKRFCTSRRRNRMNQETQNIEKTRENHMLSHMENEDENKDEDETEDKERIKFIKPSIPEIKEYCINRHNNISPELFFDFYESKGWLIGKNPMKDWKAAVRNWEKNDNLHFKKEKGYHPGQIMVSGKIEPYGKY